MYANPDQVRPFFIKTSCNLHFCCLRLDDWRQTIHIRSRNQMTHVSALKTDHWFIHYLVETTIPKHTVSNSYTDQPISIPTLNHPWCSPSKAYKRTGPTQIIRRGPCSFTSHIVGEKSYACPLHARASNIKPKCSRVNCCMGGSICLEVLINQFLVNQPDHRRKVPGIEQPLTIWRRPTNQQGW